MSENEDIQDPNADASDPDVDADATALAVDMGGNKMVPLSALIAAKRELKTTKGRVKELEPKIEWANSVNERLTGAQPIIDAIISNPKLKAEALRIAQGTRATSETTVQPDATDDPQATDFAEDMGMYLSDGHTPDIARARRVLTKLDERHGKQTDERMRPLAGVALGQKAEANLRQAAAQTDDYGVPLATMESIKEVASSLPPHLLADPNVVEVVLNSAIGIDRRKGRTPKLPDDPLYLAQAGGGRAPRESVIDADMKAFLARNGISEKDGAATIRNLEVGVQTRKGVTFGSK